MTLHPPINMPRALLLLAAVLLLLSQGLSAAHYHLETSANHDCVTCQLKDAPTAVSSQSVSPTPCLPAPPITVRQQAAHQRPLLTAYHSRAPPFSA